MQSLFVYFDITTLLISGKKNSRAMSCDLYIFSIFFRERKIVQSFIIAGYVCQILWRGASPSFLSSSKKAHPE